MRTEDNAPGIIEIIDDEVDPFGDVPSHTIHDTGGPRWIGPVAAAALVAIVGYGVATSASSGAPKVAPAPTTTIVRPTTTVPKSSVPSSSTVPAPQIGYYAATPPDDFTIAFADAGEVGRAFFPGIYELWATAGSSATIGSWFAVDTEPGRPSSVGAYRVQAGDLSVAISHISAGLSRATYAATEAGTVTITALGVSDDPLVQLAQAVRIGRATMSITDPTLVDGYQMVSSLSPARVIVGTPVETVLYQSATDPSRSFGLQIAPRNGPNLGGSDVARQTAAQFALDQPTPFEVNGHPALAGPITGQTDAALATWIEDDHIVTLSGSMGVQELMGIAGTVHEVSANAWFDMQSHTTGTSAGSPDAVRGQPSAVAFGTDGAGNPWTISASVNTFPPNPREIDWTWDQNGWNTVAGDTPLITTVVDSQRTYVLADLPRAVTTTSAKLQIDRPGLDPVVVDFNDIDPSLDRTLAAYAFNEPTQYTAQIVGADGTVFASWPQ